MITLDNYEIFVDKRTSKNNKEELIISIIIAYLKLENKENNKLNINYFLNYINNLINLDKKTLKQISNNIWEQLEG